MTTISKKAAKRISELLGEASLYRSLSELSAGDEASWFWIYSLSEGEAVRALFDEFGIEAHNLSWFTKERIEGLKIRVADIENEWAAL